MRPIDILPEQHKKMFFTAVNIWQEDYGEATNTKQTRDNSIFAEWDKSKNEYLFKMFGNELILHKPFKYQKCQEQIMAEIRDELLYGYGTDAYAFIEDYRDKVVGSVRRNDPEWDGVRQWMLESLLDSAYLATNKYEESSFEIPIPDSDRKFKITHGCKVIKTLGKIADAYHLKHFEDFRIAHSMILNNSMVQGELTLSIHPNDYATMSDNTYNWDSCMSWWNNGGFAQGTVEMMNSPMIVVAYVDGDKNPIDFGGGEWSNKKWRELFVVNEDVITEVCSYPYINQSITQECLRWLRRLAIDNLGWSQFEALDTNFVSFDDGLGWLSDGSDEDGYRLSFRTGYMYNDFRFTHEGYYVRSRLSKNNDWYYSGKSECLWCGETKNIDLEDEGRLVGLCCDDSWICQCCGERVYGDRFQVGDDYICECCYDNSTDTCQCCGDVHIIDDINVIYLGDYDDGWVDRDYCISLCDDCYDSEIDLITTENGGVRRMNVPYDTLKYIDYHHLTPYGIRKFYGEDMEVEEFLATYEPGHKTPRFKGWWEQLIFKK